MGNVSGSRKFSFVLSAFATFTIAFFLLCTQVKAAQYSAAGSLYVGASSLENGQTGSVTFSFQNTSSVSMDRLGCIIPWNYYSDGQDLTTLTLYGDASKQPPFAATGFATQIGGAATQNWTLDDYSNYLWGGNQAAIDLNFQAQSSGFAALNSAIAPGQTVTVTTYFQISQRGSGPAPKGGDYIVFSGSNGCNIITSSGSDSLSAQSGSVTVNISGPVTPPPAPAPAPTPAPTTETSTKLSASSGKKVPAAFLGADSKTTDFARLTEEQATNYPNLILDIVEFGNIEFTSNVNLNDASFADNLESLDNYVKIQNGLIMVDTEKLSVLKGKSAKLTMKGLDLDSENIVILRDGKDSTGYVSNVTYDKTTKVLTFNVTEFSTYTVADSSEDTLELTVTSTATNTPAPKAKSSTNVALIILLTIIVVAILLIAGLLVYMKKYNLTIAQVFGRSKKFKT